MIEILRRISVQINSGAKHVLWNSSKRRSRVCEGLHNVSAAQTTTSFSSIETNGAKMQISVIFRNADKGNGISVTALPVQQQRGSQSVV